MFRIVDFKSTTDGKSRLTIETDDFASALMLRFLTQADKFAQLYHYRITTEKRSEISQKTRSGRMGQMRQDRARLLKSYREIPGTRKQRMKIIQEICMSEGTRITLDRLEAKLKMAIEEEKLHKQILVKRMLIKGKSLNDIATSLSIPKSTVARYARAKKTKIDSMLALVGTSEETATNRHEKKSVLKQ